MVNFMCQFDWAKEWPVKHDFWVCQWACFQKRLVFESVDWVKKLSPTMCVKLLLRGGEKYILFYLLSWFSLTNTITVKLNLCFFGEASDMWLIIGLLIWRFMAGKMLIFLFIIFLNVKLRDKTYNCIYLKKRCPDPLYPAGEISLHKWVTIRWWKN